MTNTRPYLWKLAVLSSLVIVLAHAAIEVEHSFDGAVFRPAGKIVGDLNSDTQVEWQRPALTSDDLELVERAAASDGLYLVRVKTEKGALLTSVPAKCLLLADLKEQAAIHASHEGFIEAFNYDVKACSSAVKADGSTAAAAGSDGGDGGAVGRPERLPVRVLVPIPGPLLVQPEVAGEFADVSVDAMDLGGAASASVAFDPNAKPRAAAGGSAGGPQAAAAAGARKGGPPPKDERTWLQKNWLMVVAVGMVILNVVAKANQPPPPQGGGGAPGGAAAAGAARRG